MYRTKVVIEILSEDPVNTEDSSVNIWLDTIADQINDGDWSGAVENLGSEKLNKRDMALCLLAQGSDPEFLLGEDGWKYSLQPGDEVHIDTGDNELGPSVIIQSILYIFGDDDTEVVQIISKEGEKIECLVSEIN